MQILSFSRGLLKYFEQKLMRDQALTLPFKLRRFFSSFGGSIQALTLHFKH
jgi:hypothetical protein